MYNVVRGDKNTRHAEIYAGLQGFYDITARQPLCERGQVVSVCKISEVKSYDMVGLFNNISSSAFKI